MKQSNKRKDATMKISLEKPATGKQTATDTFAVLLNSIRMISEVAESEQINQLNTER
jgi:hypothetical protein